MQKCNPRVQNLQKRGIISYDTLFTNESTSYGIRNGGHLGFSAAILLANLGHLGPLMSLIHQNIVPEKITFLHFFPASSKVEPNAPGLNIDMGEVQFRKNPSKYFFVV